MQFCPKNREDISRYFRHTFVKLQEFGEQLFFIESVEQLKITGTHESGEKFCIYLNDETPYEMDYILPHKSFFQHNADAVLLCRMPAKQYMRGLSPSNTTMQYLDLGGKLRAIDLDFTSLKAFVNKAKWLTLSEAIEVQGKNTVALSSRMMYHKGLMKLYVDFTAVAAVNPKGGRIDVVKPVFYDEVMDLLRAMGEEGKWTVNKVVPKVKTPKEISEAERKEALLKKYPHKNKVPYAASSAPGQMVMPQFGGTNQFVVQDIETL